MSVEQVAMAMWVGYWLDQHEIQGAGSTEYARRCVAEWPELDAQQRAEWRTRARTYLRALGRIK